MVEKQPVIDGTQGNPNVHMAHLLWNVSVFTDLTDFMFLMQPDVPKYSR